MLTQDETYDAADAIELAMETQPMGYGWTPSAVARKAARVTIGGELRKLTSIEAWETLRWMVDHVFVTTDDRGAWSHYYRRH